jgi:hypothetical protein
MLPYAIGFRFVEKYCLQGHSTLRCRGSGPCAFCIWEQPTCEIMVLCVRQQLVSITSRPITSQLLEPEVLYLPRWAGQVRLNATLREKVGAGCKQQGELERQQAKEAGAECLTSSIIMYTPYQYQAALSVLAWVKCARVL